MALLSLEIRTVGWGRCRKSLLYVSSTWVLFWPHMCTTLIQINISLKKTRGEYTTTQSEDINTHSSDSSGRHKIRSINEHLSITFQQITIHTLNTGYVSAL